MKNILLVLFFFFVFIFDAFANDNNANFVGNKITSNSIWTYNIKYDTKIISGNISFINNKTTIIDFTIDNTKYLCKLEITSTIGYKNWDISGSFGGNDFTGTIVYNNSTYEMNLLFSDKNTIIGKIKYDNTTPSYSFVYFNKKMEGTIIPKNLSSLLIKFVFDNKIAEGSEKLSLFGSSSIYKINMDNLNSNETFLLLFFDFFHSLNIILWR